MRSVFLALAWAIERLLRHLVRRAGRYDLAHMLSSFAFWVTLFVGFLVVITVLLPSMRPVDIFASLGIGSVALGFAFKDILQNWIAGFFILIRRPFHRGDQIKIGDIEGTVQAVETRATLVKTYSGRLVIIPNSDIYTRSVTVNTAYEHRRNEIERAGRARGRSRSGDGGAARGNAGGAGRAGGAAARRAAVGVQRQQRQHPRALVDQVAAHLRGAHARGGGHSRSSRPARKPASHCPPTPRFRSPRRRCGSSRPRAAKAKPKRLAKKPGKNATPAFTDPDDVSEELDPEAEKPKLGELNEGVEELPR